MTTTGGDVQSGRPVEIYRAANEMEAQVIKSFLESNGIPVMLIEEGKKHRDPGFSSNGSGAAQKSAQKA